MPLTLNLPNAQLLPSYIEAVREGSFNPMQLSFGVEKAENIEENPQAFLDNLTTCPPFSITLGDDLFWVQEHEMLWIAEGDRFLGAVALRYKADGDLLEAYAGHVGMAVRPMLLNRGYGLRAVRSLTLSVLKRFRAHGISRLILTCHPANRASRRLIEWGGCTLQKEVADYKGKGPMRIYSFEIKAHMLEDKVLGRA